MTSRTKMNDTNRIPHKCPICGRYYSEQPALSRKDNKTEICSMCGTKEALRDMLRYNK